MGGGATKQKGHLFEEIEYMVFHTIFSYMYLYPWPSHSQIYLARFTHKDNEQGSRFARHKGGLKCDERVSPHKWTSSPLPLKESITIKRGMHPSLGTLASIIPAHTMAQIPQQPGISLHVHVLYRPEDHLEQTC